MIDLLNANLEAALAERDRYRKALVHISTGSGVKHRDAQKIAHAALSPTPERRTAGEGTP